MAKTPEEIAAEEVAAAQAAADAAAAAATASGGKLFTQADVDAMIQKRVGSLTDQINDLKPKADQLAEIEAANQTETERLTSELAKINELNASLSKKYSDSRVNAAIVNAAAKIEGFVDPNAAVKLIDRGTVTIGDDDQVTGVDEAMTALLERSPYLVGKPGSTGPAPGAADGGVQGGGTGTVTREQLKAMDPDKVAEMFANGELKHLTETGEGAAQPT